MNHVFVVMAAFYVWARGRLGRQAASGSTL
jgi:hypothetical protein